MTYEDDEDFLVNFKNLVNNVVELGYQIRDQAKIASKLKAIELLEKAEHKKINLQNSEVIGFLKKAYNKQEL